MEHGRGQRRSIAVRTETWPIRGGFTIARGSKTEAVVVVAEIAADGATGRGECVPYARYGERVSSVMETIEGCIGPLTRGLTRMGLQKLLPPGAARNALDCALWDLEAKLASKSAAEHAGLSPLHAVETAFTISLASPEAMAEAAREAAALPAAQTQVRRRRRRRAAPRRARGRAARSPDRRRQRGLPARGPASACLEPRLPPAWS